MLSNNKSGSTIAFISDDSQYIDLFIPYTFAFLICSKTHTSIYLLPLFNVRSRLVGICFALRRFLDIGLYLLRPAPLFVEITGIEVLRRTGRPGWETQFVPVNSSWQVSIDRVIVCIGFWVFWGNIYNRSEIDDFDPAKKRIFTKIKKYTKIPVYPYIISPWPMRWGSASGRHKTS